MTEEQKKNDADRYVIVSQETNVIQGKFNNEGEAKKKAQELALQHVECEFIVYQKIGSATASAKVEWKGGAR